ncbi:hypothetical protein GOP47_0018651 [Adiantum capillus-veneris]|uniref:UspA domain-containing protein n=1 Tax=Adiantum capillus-veneris TaxID=13818 RepID=A0A9D4UE74_ADICA|nr:hypothetical protein GOP47_0018651 [Adiantum capillus-veneris]
METAATDDRQEQGAKTTVVALDESEQSLYSLSWALQTISFRESDKLLLLHAKSLPISGPACGFPGYELSSEVIISMERAQERKINAVMSKAMELCKRKQVNVEKYVVFGDPRYVICEEVEKLQADLLVVGSHGYGAVKRALLGSIKQSIKSRCTEMKELRRTKTVSKIPMEMES